MLKSWVEGQIAASIEAKKNIPVGDILKAAEILVQAYKAGRKWILAGNGGSASDAEHIAGEMVGRYLRERSAWPAIALSSNSATVTAIANDYGYAQLFARQVEAYGQKGDVFMGISTSGNSENVIIAFEKAKNLGLVTIALTGRDGGKMGKLVDLEIRVPSFDTPRIQESHILIGHILCDIVEKTLVDGEKL